MPPARDAAEALKEGQRTGTSVGRRRLRQLLVIGELALALTLLAGAGLAIHSFWNLLHVELGVRTDHVLTFTLSPPDSRPNNPEWVEAYYRRVLSRIGSTPGVSHVSVETGIPMQGPGFGVPFSIAGQAASLDAAQRPIAGFGMVSPEFFQTFGVRIEKGRAFTERDTRSSLRVAAVNEAFALRYLKGTDPLRQLIWAPEPVPGAAVPAAPSPLQIIAVIHNIRSRGLRQDVPEIYVPFWQSPWPRASIGVRTERDPASMMRTVAAAVHAVDPEIAVANSRTMVQVRDEILASDHFTAILFTSFAAIALLLAGLGIYGVMAFAAAQRSHEIALRMALGATRGAVIGLVMKEGVGLACVGMCLGLIGAYFMDRTMRSVLFGVGATDFAAIGAVVLILTITASLACYLPARRAVSVDPARLLKM